MSEQNKKQRKTDGNLDKAIDTLVDGVINETLEVVASTIPGGIWMEKLIETEVDLVANTAVNASLHKVEALVEEVDRFGRGVPSQPQGQSHHQRQVSPQGESSQERSPQEHHQHHQGQEHSQERSHQEHHQEHHQHHQE